MYEKIVVPLDGSELAEQAIPYAVMMAKEFQSEVILLTTSEPEGRFEHPLQAYMEKQTKALKSLKITAGFVCLHGNPAAEILKFAEDNGINLIVISTHGCTGDRCWPLGSIANKVVQRSSIPTLLIRPSQPVEHIEKNLRKILLALDGSPVAEKIMPYVESLAKRMGSEVILFRAIEPISMPFEASYRYRKEYEEAFVANAEKESKAYLSEHEGKLRDKGLKVISAVMKGKPDHAILQYAEDHSVSLIALTTHGFSGIAKWAYGSVAARIIEGSTKPILLMRPPLHE